MQDQSAVTADIIRKFEKQFFVPAIAAAGMGVVVWLVYHGILYVLRVNAVATLLSIVIGAAVYAVLLLLLKGLNEQEILRFPERPHAGRCRQKKCTY